MANTATHSNDTHNADIADLRAALARVEQEHVLAFYDQLDPAQQAALREQIAALPLDALPRLVEDYVKQRPKFEMPTELQPAPFYPDDRAKPVSLWGRERYRKAGEELLSQGKVAAFTVAGGQGTRLGFDGPKGAFPAGAVTKKPLFHMLADWILAAQQRFGGDIPWYIMTSPLNHQATIEFFRNEDFFGLNPANTMFFQQGSMPSFDMETGKLLLADKGAIATNPDGHGGSLRALHESGALEDMARRGVELVSYCQVDNPIVRVIDPVFLGLHAQAPDSSNEMSSKMAPKVSWDEKVGVLCQSVGRTMVIEYSDLPESLAKQQARDGELKFKAGNIAVHVVSRSFIEKIAAGDGSFALPFHRAEKKVPHIDMKTGALVEPSRPNAVKLEMFVFDALPMAEKSIVMETSRVEEFAPIKNASGQDSPDSSRDIQTERAARWLEAAGVKVPRGGDGKPQCTLEIGPLTAMQPGDLKQRTDLPREIEVGASLAL